MTTEIKEESGRAVLRTGRIAGLAYSDVLIDNVRKQQHGSAEITHLGIPGDRHYGETRYSQSQRKTLPNDRPITVVGAEATREVCAKLGIPDVPTGGLGENLQLEGLGDLSDLVEGDELHVLGANGQPKVVLRVSKQNDPCSNLRIYHRLMVKELMGRRGVICTVLQEGMVHVGDTVELVRA
jgi:MOSC domain-containing protein YiiM